MDFALTEEQQAAADLAGTILSDLCTPERLREVEASPDRFHREAWEQLARADLLGLCLPEDVGGGGCGFLDACLLLQQVGRTVAPIPLHATLACAAMPIARFGSAAQASRWLPGVVTGDTILTAAMHEPAARPDAPALRATAAGEGWVLQGAKTAVPAAHLAAAVLVPASTEDGKTKVFLVGAGAEGLTIERQDTFNHEPQFHMDFDGVGVTAADELGEGATDGAVALAAIIDWAVVGLCAMASGVCDAAMRMTAEYATNRHQFDRPIGSFQAVGHRMADCYVDNEAVRLTMLQAATKLGSGQPASREVAVAKYWAAYGGRRVGHAALHVHGGISIDLDYPIHRYFLWAKQIENTFGAASPQLATLGQLLAAEPAP